MRSGAIDATGVAMIGEFFVGKDKEIGAEFHVKAHDIVLLDTPKNKEFYDKNKDKFITNGGEVLWIKDPTIFANFDHTNPDAIKALKEAQKGKGNAPDAAAVPDAPAVPADATGKTELTLNHASVKVAAWQKAMNDLANQSTDQHLKDLANDDKTDGRWWHKTDALYVALGGNQKVILAEFKKHNIQLQPEIFEVKPPATPVTPTDNTTAR